MKMSLKKITAVAAATATAFAAMIPSAYAGYFDVPDETILNPKTSRLSVPYDAGVSYAMPQFKTLIGQDLNDFSDLCPVAGYGAITRSVELGSQSEALPQRFDMRSEGLITSVKNQASNGTCWAFASAASAETSLLKYIPSIDLSEWHTAYYPYTGEDQIDIEYDTLEEYMDYGGTAYVVANLWAQWKGPIDENKMPYDDFTFFDDADRVEEYKNAADYHLENAYLFDFEEDGSNREYINSLIKQFIYSGHAVDVSYSTDGYSYSTNAARSYKEPKYANHSVTIAGWDDNYTASNFDGSTGAWLVRNSWDTGFGDAGYFWISYEDTSLSELAVFELAASDNYTTNYQHDSFVPTQSMSADDNEEINQPSYMANVFTAENDEQIEAVATYINYPGTEYEITVYTGITDMTDPTSGTPSAVTSGVSELTGYITIELDNDIIVEAGESFAVSVKMYCEDSKFVIPLETSMLLEDPQDGTLYDLSSYTTYEKINTYTGENESFYSENGSDWTDVTEKNYEYTEEEKNELVEAVIAENEDMTQEQIDAYRALFEGKNMSVIMGNISLKAFANPVNTVDFSHDSGNVPLNEAVELSVKDGSDIYYSINGGDEILYTEPIAVTETMEITATADGEIYTTKTYTPAKAEISSIGYYSSALYMDNKDIIYAERVDESTFNIYLSGAESSLRLHFVSAADITRNGTAVVKNCFGASIAVDNGVTTLTYELSQENCLDNTVTLNIYRGYVNIDVETETVLFDGIDTLTASDGHEFTNGESVSAYAGQTLTAVAGDTVTEIIVPERAVLPELEVDYLNETLNFLPNEIAEFTEYAIGESPAEEDYISAEARCIDGQNITSGMIMNKAFRIIPGETVTLRVAPGNGKFGSEAVTFEIPGAGVAPTESAEYSCTERTYHLEYSDILEYGIAAESITEEELAVMAANFGYDTEEYAALMTERYALSSREELLYVLGAEWDAIFELTASPQESTYIAVRYYSTDNEFASAVSFSELIYVAKGDFDFNGTIDAIDASLVLTYYAQKSTGKNPVITDKEFEAGDYDCDGNINSLDASEILTYYAEKATSGL